MDMQTDAMVQLSPELKAASEGKKQRFDKWWLLVFFVIFLIIYLATTKSDPFWRIIVFVQDGIWVSISTTVITFFLVLVVGLFIGLGRLSKKQIDQRRLYCLCGSDPWYSLTGPIDVLVLRLSIRYPVNRCIIKH